MAWGVIDGRLSDWKREIERLSGGSVQVIAVVTDTTSNVLRIPDSFPGRSIVRQLLLRKSFVLEFIRAYSLAVNYTGVEGSFHFVLLNQAMAGKWADQRDLLIAHEFGHIWLNAIGYRSPDYESCLSTHAGDIVHHVLIREEMKRRGFALSFWIRNLEEWRQRMATPGGSQPLEPCERLQLVSQWMDAELGMAAEAWAPLPGLLARARALYPDVVPAVQELADFLRGRNLWDRSIYEAAVYRVMVVLRGVMGR